MVHRNPKVLVIAGDGINCELETAQAFQKAKFDVELAHLNDLILRQVKLDQLSSEYSALALPGGFSFGDDLSSGKVLALKLQHRLRWDLPTYVSRGGLVLGICNGFQALIRLGVFGSEVSITHNLNGKFMNAWTQVMPHGTRSLWLSGVGDMDLPIRHGEGRIVIAPSRKSETLEKMDRLGMTCLKYRVNPNGSQESLAGLCDPSGRILGLMPHPEGFIRWTAHPEWTAQPGRASSPGQGLAIFENAYREALKSL
ncbi:MAG: phosphoribosylformylglycinamidine synthase subunit PurQ [Bdellovibrionia bacterium]